MGALRLKLNLKLNCTTDFKTELIERDRERSLGPTNLLSLYESANFKAQSRGSYSKLGGIGLCL